MNGYCYGSGIIDCLQSDFSYDVHYILCQSALRINEIEILYVCMYVCLYVCIQIVYRYTVHTNSHILHISKNC
jgi:hypothetical protein